LSKKVGFFFCRNSVDPHPELPASFLRLGELGALAVSLGGL
jgi:hypothetical protein